MTAGKFKMTYMVRMTYFGQCWHRPPLLIYAHFNSHQLAALLVSFTPYALNFFFLL